MAYNNNIRKKSYEILEERRQNALKNQEQLKAKIYKELPRLKEIEMQLAVIGAEAAKSVLSGASAGEINERLSQKSLELQKESKTILFENGYNSNILEPKFHCSKCCDKGEYDNEFGRTVVCDCLKKLQTELACEELNKVSPLTLSSFDNFSLNYYDLDVQPGLTMSPYDRMSKILDYCKRYARDFSLNSPSMFMRGSTGLGKTHLSLAIANEVIKSGFGVVYVSAPMILSKLEKQHFSYAYQEEDETINTLVTCDLLIIDDLGTEFQSQYSISTIYNIFNTRLLNKKPTIMNSNLTLRDLEKIYSPRFVSRILGECAKLDFLGKDIRLPRR